MRHLRHRCREDASSCLGRKGSVEGVRRWSRRQSAWPGRDHHGRTGSAAYLRKEIKMDDKLLTMNERLPIGSRPLRLRQTEHCGAVGRRTRQFSQTCCPLCSERSRAPGRCPRSSDTSTRTWPQESGPRGCPPPLGDPWPGSQRGRAHTWPPRSVSQWMGRKRKPPPAPARPQSATHRLTASLSQNTKMHCFFFAPLILEHLSAPS